MVGASRQHERSSRAGSGGSRSTSAGHKSTGSSPSQAIAPSAFDGNVDPNDAPMPKQQDLISKNLDLPVTVWAHTTNTPVEIQARPPPSTLGREIKIGLNTWNVLELPRDPVYQYDVLMGNGDEKRPVIRKLWASKPLQSLLPKSTRWIFDGNKIAYSTEKLERDIRIRVDLDAEEGRTPRPGKNNVFKVEVKATRTNAVIHFEQLSAYLAGKADFGTGCLEAINFLDHLLREHPSQNLTPIKRCFYRSGGQRSALGGGAELLKGTYASMRIGHSMTGNHTLTVNVDNANGTFWTAGPLSDAVAAVLRLRSSADIGRGARGEAASRALKKLRKVHVQAKHRPGHVDSYCIDKFLDQTPSQCRIPAEGDRPATTVAEFFLKQYNIRVRPDWPAVKMTKGKNTILPLELLTIEENQRVMGKLDEKQTAQMIRYAVTPPLQRWQDIQNALSALNWPGDQYVKGYGLKISSDPVEAKARVIPNPKVTFANGDLDPKTSGRWRIDGKKFLLPNRNPLKSWGVCIIGGCIDQSAVTRFIGEFVKTYATHGGKVENRTPHIYVPSNQDPATAVQETYTATGNKFKLEPQMLVFILPDKNQMTYGRIKKSTECRFGTPSQCMQASHVMKCQGQYISNVCMKFNAKLGGITARACGTTSTAKGHPNGIFKHSTMIVAADVTHPAPGGQPGADESRYSIAAIVNSQDKLATRYTARVETNGYRMEMIQPRNWEKLWLPQLRNWMSGAGGGRLPQTIIYFRDGLSEGQFSALIRQELSDMKEIVRKIDPKHQTKFVVIVASKRHHIRFFPPKGTGDNNGNALPGTLVETAVTHPYENDFFLCSHVALKGTARPVHYHVLVNEASLDNKYLQTMIYEHSYQYMRATTPVSLFPAVYYADICALRGKYHDRAFGSTQPSRGRDQVAGGAPGSRGQSGGHGATSSSDSAPSDIPDLMESPKGLSETMWYI